jgi:hypothetical protein
MRVRRIGFRGGVFPLVVFAALLVLGGGAAWAAPVPSTVRWAAATQDESDGGFATLNITVDDEGYHLIESVEAGWYVVALNNATEDDVVADLVMLPGGMEIDEFQRAFSTENGGSTVPDWLEEAVFAGGPSAPAQSEGQTLVELTPGTWTILQTGLVGGRSAELVVTEADDPAPPPGLDPNVEVTFAPGALTMPSQIPVGEQVWRVANTDTLTHAVALVLLPDEFSEAEMRTLLTTGDAPEGIDVSKSLTAGGIGLLSGGRTIWTLFNLNPGYYVALDYTPLKDGRTYAEIGRFALFTVQ